MTTNQTIDGVPRELLGRIADPYRREPRSIHLHNADIAELRALLDAPACKTCDGLGHVPDGEISGSGGVEFENGPVECVKDCPACKPAAQPQGEPVAWLNVATGHVTTIAVVVMDWDDEKEQVKSLYAEQPAPVAHTMKSVMKVICSIDGFPMLTSNQCHALAVKLNERYKT